jgi:hypothetical protein
MFRVYAQKRHKILSLVPGSEGTITMQVEFTRADRDDIPILLEGGFNGIYFPLQLTDWPLFEVVLLLIGRTKISVTKSSFNHQSAIESPRRLSWKTETTFHYF